MPTTEPIISGTMIMLRRWVFTTAGFSLGGASFFALRSFLIKPMGLRLSPRWNRLRARAWTTYGERVERDCVRFLLDNVRDFGNLAHLNEL